MQVRYILDHVNHDDLVAGADTGVGPWIDFVPDPGWTSQLRYRLTPLGLQLDGGMTGALQANATARMGILPPGYRPIRLGFLPATVVVPPATYGFGTVWGDQNGWLQTYWTIAGNGSLIAISGVLALD
jgi:hypothetical protein